MEQMMGRNYSDFMRSLAAKYNNANPNEYVCTVSLTRVSLRFCGRESMIIVSLLYLIKSRRRCRALARKSALETSLSFYVFKRDARYRFSSKREAPKEEKRKKGETEAANRAMRPIHTFVRTSTREIIRCALA